MPDTPMVLSVGQVSAYIKNLLESDSILTDVYIRGEISNYKLHTSGHHYMTLKDESAVLSAVMFRSDAYRMKFRLENGMKVIAHGRISLFAKSGQYQIYIREMIPDGVGALYVAFEQLKERLAAEGLFAPERKKKLPAYPQTIALVTSPTGAAVRDMIRILHRRFPPVRILVCPVKVQGEGAAQEIADMLDFVNKNHLADVIITGRGGGSLEDLWAFNEEVTARAIARSAIPVISAVGHEPDVTIADFAADVRVATPSNAAELAVADASELQAQLDTACVRMRAALGRSLRLKRERLQATAQKKVMRSPIAYLGECRLTLDYHDRRMQKEISGRLTAARAALSKAAATLDAISPLRVLARGYSIAKHEGRPVTDARMLTCGDSLDLVFAAGGARCEVVQIIPAGQEGA